jgi:hypothetical protein
MPRRDSNRGSGVGFSVAEGELYRRCWISNGDFNLDLGSVALPRRHVRYWALIDRLSIAPGRARRWGSLASSDIPLVR